MSDLDAAYQQRLIDRKFPPLQYTPEGALVVEISGAGPMPEGTNTQPQGSAAPKADGQVDEAQLKSDPQFLQDVNAIHQAFTGKPFQGDPGALAEWGIEKLANFELAMGDMTNPSGDAAGGGMIGQAAQILNKFTPEQAGSFLRALDAYDKLPMFTLPGFGRLVRNAVADPTALVGVATVGAGLAGRQAGRVAAKEGIKTALRQRIGESILANPVKVGAAEAATYTGGGDLIKQNVEIKGGTRNAVDPLQAAGSTAIGAAAGAGITKAVQVAAPYVGKAVKAGMENLAAPVSPKVGPGAQRGAVGDLSQQKVFQIVSQAESEGWDAKKILETLKTLGLKDEPKADVAVKMPMGKAHKELVTKFPQEFTDVADMSAPTQRNFEQTTNKAGKEVTKASFASRLDEDGKWFWDWTDKNRNNSAIHHNSKTGNSIDFSTSCANRGCGAGACAYCYVEHARTLKDAFGEASQAKKVDVENDYLGEIMRMPPSLIKAYNMDGGLRMFSFGDFRPGIDDDNVRRVLDDAAKRGLFVKAITKEVELLKRFGDHPNFRANLSIDNVPREISHAPTIDEAIALKQQFPNLRLRVVALNMQEADMFAARKEVDVITLYHGVTNWEFRDGKRVSYTGKLSKLVKAQNPRIFEEMGDEKAKQWLDTWENLSPNTTTAKQFQAKHEGRVCCQSGKCAGDATKCGFATKVANAGGVALLLLGGANSIFLGEADDNQVMWQ